MADFAVIINKCPDQWLGGPPNFCHECNFQSETHKWYLHFPGLKVLRYGQVEVDLILCEEHATKTKVVLDEVLPDKRVHTLQGRLLTAEASRAAAVKRADKAEVALHALQDWNSEIKDGIKK
jgi:hypothetical protein